MVQSYDMDYGEQEPPKQEQVRAPPKQRAANWLAGVAGEEDEVKDMILQDLWKKEGFQSA